MHDMRRKTFGTRHPTFHAAIRNPIRILMRLRCVAHLAGMHHGVRVHVIEVPADGLRMLCQALQSRKPLNTHNTNGV